MLVSPSVHPGSVSTGSGFLPRQCSCLFQGSVFLLTAVFYPAIARPAVMNECERRRRGVFFLQRKSGGRGGVEGLVRGSRWPPRLSALFKEHCGRSPESNKPDYTACGNLRPLGARLPILPHQDLMLKC